MEDKYTLRGVLSCQIFDAWPYVLPYLEKALKFADDKYTIQDIQIAIIQREMQLWVIVDELTNIHAVIVTQIVSYPNKKVMLIVLMSGVEFCNWKHLLNQFIQYAQDLSCVAIEGYGRQGWKRKLEPLGFKTLYTHYSLPLEGC